MAEKIYVVMGTSGEYSDRTEWPIVAYMSEERAKQKVLELDEKERQRVLATGRTSSMYDEDYFYYDVLLEGVDEG